MRQRPRPVDCVCPAASASYPRVVFSGVWRRLFCLLSRSGIFFGRSSARPNSSVTTQFVEAVHHPQPQRTKDMTSPTHSFHVALVAVQATPPVLSQLDSHRDVSKDAASALCCFSGDLRVDSPRGTDNDSRIAGPKFLCSSSPMAGLQFERIAETSIGKRRDLPACLPFIIGIRIANPCCISFATDSVNNIEL